MTYHTCQQQQIISKLNYIESAHLRICIFGCGTIGKGIGYDILKFLGLNLFCYCDNNNDNWGKEVKDGIKCISPKELSQMNRIACIVMTSVNYQKKIIEQLKEYGIPIIITYHELVTLDIIINRFLEQCSKTGHMKDNACDNNHEFHILPVSNIENKKYAIYTCITGDYDKVVEPQYYTEECDYYLISDNKPANLKIFKWINIKELVPEFVKDNIRKNRFCKIHGSFIFSEYEYSIYMDGNIQIMGDVRKYVNNIGKSGIAAYKLPSWDDLYSHVVNSIKYDKPSLVMEQMDKYHKEGMPRHYGMFECTILVRYNANPICKKIMVDWWKEVYRYSYRDQFSFTYCLWKNGIKVSDIGVLGDNYRNSKDFRRTEGHHKNK